MAVTVANVQRPRVPGAEKRVVKEITFDNSYAEGGEPLTFKDLEMKNVVFAEVIITNGSENEAEFPVDSGYYTPSTEKIHLLNSKTSKEVAKEKNVEKVKALIVAYGW